MLNHNAPLLIRSSLVLAKTLPVWLEGVPPAWHRAVAIDVMKNRV